MCLFGSDEFFHFVGLRSAAPYGASFSPLAAVLSLCSPSLLYSAASSAQGRKISPPVPFSCYPAMSPTSVQTCILQRFGAVCVNTKTHEKYASVVVTP